MVRTYPHHPSASRLAGRWPRFASLAYEAVLLVPILFIAAYLFLAFTHEARTPPMKLLFQLWLLGVLAAYFSYCWTRSGQTLAMKTWGLRLARHDGTRLSARQALGRFALAVWSVGLLGLGLLWSFVDRERQFLHDRLAGTRIFEVRQDGLLASAAPAGVPARRRARGTHR